MREFGSKAVAESMSPEDRAHMVSIADGFGRMIIALHRAESEAFAARYPDAVTIREGYRKIEGDRYVGPYLSKKRVFSIEPTMFGMQVARMIERFDMSVTWPEIDAEAA